MGKTKTAEISGEVEKKKKTKPAGTKEAKAPGLKGGERVAAVSGEPLPEESNEEAKDTKKDTKKTEPKVRGKKYQDARAKIDKTKTYPLADAVKLVKDASFAKFDATVELHATVKKEGLSVNVDLPHATGMKKKIEVADESTLKKLKDGKVDFDVLLATADMMPKLVPFAKILGPKGLMPNPKNGTLIKDAKDADKFSASTMTIKTERKAPLVHTVVGKVSQEDKELVENIKTVIAAVGERQIVKAYLTATMSPSVRLSL